ncbi:MFS transporter [Streptacidiphilus anmyonensis]|uniref:MFS transporter n=1 Tax=Streptacidiphilus anmyonensis TaxID=405782 RepID=UPI000693D4CE|nr:MFS transporter [Streptacidiphilus anmyonensis]
MRVLMAHRGIRLFLLGQTVSMLSDSVLWLTVAIWARMLTGSSSAAGLSFFMLGLGSVGSPVGGALADRLPRRALLAAANAAAAGLVLLLVFVHGAGQLWLMYVVMFGSGLTTGTLASTQTSLLQAVVPAGLLGEANIALQTGRWGGRLVTPLLGAGLLARVGPDPVVIGDAASFMVALAATLPVLRAAPAPLTPGPRPWLAGAAAGALHIRRTAALRPLALAGTLTLTAFGLSESTAFEVVRRGLHRPDSFLGVVVSLQGGGALVAGACSAVLLRRLDAQRLTAAGIVCAAAGFLLSAASPAFVTLAGTVLIGAGLPWITAGVSTALQQRTPAALIGRADAALRTMIAVPQTIAIGLGSALVSTVDYRLVLLLVVALLAASAAYLIRGRAPGPLPRTHRSAPAARPAHDGALSTSAPLAARVFPNPLRADHPRRGISSGRIQGPGRASVPRRGHTSSHVLVRTGSDDGVGAGGQESRLYTVKRAETIKEHQARRGQTTSQPL